MARPVVLVTGRHRPHELLLLAVSVVLGAAYLLGSPPPASIASLMPRWVVDVWAAGLVVSGVAGLVGCFWRQDIVLGLGLEMGGMLIGAGAILIYCVAVIAVTGLAGAFTASLTGAWMAANLIRAGQIRRDLSILTNGE